MVENSPAVSSRTNTTSLMDLMKRPSVPMLSSNNTRGNKNQECGNNANAGLNRLNLCSQQHRSENNNNNNSHEEEVDEDPSLSSAAQCMKLQLALPMDDDDEDDKGENEWSVRQNYLSDKPCTGKSPRDNEDGDNNNMYVFGPTFVHQIFEGERIRGYQPLYERRQKAGILDSEGKYVHSSYERNNPDDDEMDIRIILSPSCRTCRISIKTRRATKKRPSTIAPASTSAAATAANDTQGEQFEPMPKKTRRLESSPPPPPPPSGHAGEGTATARRRQQLTRTCRNRSPYSNNGTNGVTAPSYEEDGGGSGGGGEGRGGGGEDDDDYAPTEEESESTSADDEDYRTEEDTCDLKGKDETPSSTDNDNINEENPKEKEEDDDVDETIMPVVTAPPSVCTRNRRMTVAEIREQLARCLPSNLLGSAEDDTMFDDDDDEVQLRNDYLKEPIGTVISEYSTAAAREQPQSQPSSLPSPLPSQEFCLTVASGDEAAGYHNDVQKLAVFFIETADEVDVTSTKDGGYWRVMYLFRKHPYHDDNSKEKEGGGDQLKQQRYRYSLAGYMTLFAFVAPFRKPQPGTILRICQALLLPPYQRAGHGRKMFHAVYDYFTTTSSSSSSSSSPTSSPTKLFLSNKGTVSPRKTNSITGNSIDKVVEINVESPAPAFVALRNRVDYERFLRLKDTPGVKSWCWNRDGMTDGRITRNTVEKWFVPLDDFHATKIASALKVTTKQVHLIYEMDRLRQLEDDLASSASLCDPGAGTTGNDNNNRHENSNTRNNASPVVVDYHEIMTCKMIQQQREDMEKRYRLMVKKRLNKMHREEMGACRNKKEMQDLLSKLYDKSIEHYRKILKSVHRRQQAKRL